MLIAIKKTTREAMVQDYEGGPSVLPDLSSRSSARQTPEPRGSNTPTRPNRSGTYAVPNAENFEEI
ncbi:hypothetical protein P389DRAFT_176260 [Cystobasidium minutum MCA 4210]|uniref:uncharacterized protein n=1 Tax=Cystobasidium minutum MCA 4210 TaxID=1397322 RepID=UPI0034CE4C81|eukprot:jgi/Rhomi1/176260/fgenesh1_kg.12_\